MKKQYQITSYFQRSNLEVNLIQTKQCVDIHPCHLLFDHFQFALIHGHDIPGSYAILLLTASDLAWTKSSRALVSGLQLLIWQKLFLCID